MSGRKIITLIPCHLSSQRVPLKPLQKLSSGVSLLDNALAQVARLRDALNPHFSCWTGDRELLLSALEFGLPIIPMSYEQSRSKDWGTISQAWANLKTDWVYEVNNICHPFLLDSTILKGLEYIKVCTYPFISARKQRNIFWNEDETPLLMSSGPVNTQTAPTIISATHALYGWQPSDCGPGNEKRITNFEPLVLDYESIELIDIDDGDDLRLVQRIRM